VLQGQALRPDEGPVVLHALVSGHPVGHRLHPLQKKNNFTAYKKKNFISCKKNHRLQKKPSPSTKKTTFTAYKTLVSFTQFILLW
jgi:hypothetical protein